MLSMRLKNRAAIDIKESSLKNQYNFFGSHTTRRPNASQSSSLQLKKQHNAVSSLYFETSGIIAILL